MTYSLKDYLTYYSKVFGILPTRYLLQPQFKKGSKLISWALIEIDRCEVDRAIVGSSQAALSAHLGHRMKQPTTVSFFELIKFWIQGLYETRNS